MASHLTHVDRAGAARMVDVSSKDISVRQAVAAGSVTTNAQVISLLRADGLPKGDALAVARLAGITGAKRTPDLVPLCHPIALHGVSVHLDVRDDAVDIRATVRTADRTGVEMEALTAVATAGLALIDMIKAVDPAAVLTDIRVLRKEGGKTGIWERETEAGAGAQAGVDEKTDERTDEKTGARALVIVASNRAAAGIYADTSGPLLVAGLRELGCQIDEPVVVPDGPPVREAMRAAVAAGFDLVVTSGGTGISPTDATPQMTRELLDYEVPGIADAIRTASRGAVPAAALSRGVAGVAGRTLIINLPGSRGGAKDGLAVLRPILAHALDQLRGGDH